jgi:YD repeat-containing protein
MRRFLRAQLFAIVAGGALWALPATGDARVVADGSEKVGWTSGVSYSYDGSGNVRQIGRDTFAYDHAGRLVQAKVNDVQRDYEYDTFGNRTKCLQADGGDCQHGFAVSRENNQVIGAGYDGAGNVTSFAGHTYSYDDGGMMTRDDFGPALAREYIYTDENERIAIYNAGSSWEWTVRDADGRVLRELTSADGSSGPEFVVFASYFGDRWHFAWPAGLGPGGPLY